MHPYPRCTCCGRLISQYIREYHKRDQANLARLAEEGILPEYARVNNTIGVHSKEIFEDLGVETICCRLAIKTCTYFRSDVYGTIGAQPKDTPRASKYLVRPKGQ